MGPFRSRTGGVHDVVVLAAVEGRFSVLRGDILVFEPGVRLLAITED